MALPARLACLAALLAVLPALAQDRAATMGKQRAAGAKLEWEIREAGHPALGNIRFAYLKRAPETRSGDLTIHSRVYFSCQLGRRTFAIELSNTLAPADPGGLKPAADPRLTCHRPAGDKVVREEITTGWLVAQKVGDAMTSGLRAFPLRECAWITVAQEVELPAGSKQKSQHIELELNPYARELDAIFVSCGEKTAYGSGQAPPVVASAVPAPVKPAAAPAVAIPTPTPPTPPPAAAAPVPAAGAGWREARVVPTGKTNVRASPTLQSKVVAELFPGAVVMVQGNGTEWWRARPNRGTAFDGYIRQDRLVLP